MILFNMVLFIRKIMKTSLNKRHLFNSWVLCFSSDVPLFNVFFQMFPASPNKQNWLRGNVFAGLRGFWTLAWCKLYCPCNPLVEEPLFWRPLNSTESSLLWLFVRQAPRYNSQCFPLNPCNQTYYICFAAKKHWFPANILSIHWAVQVWDVQISIFIDSMRLILD